jgi:integrase
MLTVAQRPYIPMLVEANTRRGFFEADQFQAVREELAPELARVVSVAYITGWRISSEILTRQRHHVDLANGWLRLEPGEGKTGQGRMFPLLPQLRAVLEEQLEDTRKVETSSGRIIPWLFHRKGEPIVSFRRAWKGACKRAGLTGRIPHDFRRSAVRNLERAGVPRSAAMAMVGHRTQSVYSRYAIADESMLRDGAARLAALHDSDRAAGRTVVSLAEARG